MMNPFLYIVPREEEKLVNKEFLEDLKKKVDKVFKGGCIIILNGEYGSGKTLLADKVKEYILKNEKIELKYFFFVPQIAAQIKNLKEKEKEIFVIIDGFDLIMGVDDEVKKEILSEIYNKIESGISFLITCNEKTKNEIFEIFPKLKEKSEVLKIPPLSYEETKKLIIERLNEVRKEKSNSLEPFSEAEVRRIWERSRGNPRMVLLLCSSLFDAKAGII